jgi:hypothetical protein
MSLRCEDSRLGTSPFPTLRRASGAITIRFGKVSALDLDRHLPSLVCRRDRRRRLLCSLRLLCGTARWPKPKPKLCAIGCSTHTAARMSAANATKDQDLGNLALGRATYRLLPRRARPAPTDPMLISDRPSPTPRIQRRRSGTRRPPRHDSRATNLNRALATTTSTNKSKIVTEEREVSPSTPANDQG